MSEREHIFAELMTRHAELISEEIQPFLQGHGMRTQGAVLADLVSLWLAGIWAEEELRAGFKEAGPSTVTVRAMVFKEWSELVLQLVPDSERELMARVEPEGHA